MQVNCTVHCFLSEQRNSLALFTWTYTVHANCTVQWTVQLACTVRKKQHFAAFSFPASQTQKHVGPIHSKLCIFLYQTAANCVLIKTQPQPQSAVVDLLTAVVVLDEIAGLLSARSSTTVGMSWLCKEATAAVIGVAIGEGGCCNSGRTIVGRRILKQKTMIASMFK